MVSTIDEASLCPKCKTPGDHRVTRPIGRGEKLLTIYCTNNRCSWYDTPWNVSIRADGTIPDPEYHRGQKQYVGFGADNILAKDLIESLKLATDNSKNGGAEV